MHQHAALRTCTFEVIQSSHIQQFIQSSSNH